jgi:prophage regulatory protein
MAEKTKSPTSLLRLPAVKARVALSGPTVWRLIRKSAFPAPIKSGTRAVAWLECEVEQWIAEKAAARQPQNGRG